MFVEHIFSYYSAINFEGPHIEYRNEKLVCNSVVITIYIMKHEISN